MVYNSTANASIPTAASNLKKKRVNRTAKLKQCKLDVRREQWLSQVKNKGFKEENKGADLQKVPVLDMHAPKKSENLQMVKLVVNPEENDSLMNHFTDWESPTNSPIGQTSDISGTNFNGSSSSSTSSSGCYSGSMTEEDDGDDGCLDDWESIADALAADEIKSDHNSSPDPQMNHQFLQSEPVETNQRIKDGQVNFSVNHHAWKPDDCFRPQGLPNLAKQNSFPMNVAWGIKNVAFAPTACPICCEDLDLTDSSFLPCPCGYRLCLFCYKRIVEDNGRCPGCRKQYEQFDQGGTVFKLARSYSMIARH